MCIYIAPICGKITSSHGFMSYVTYFFGQCTSKFSKLILLHSLARELISVQDDWYVGEYFSCIRIWGSNIVHLLPRIVPDRMVLQEFAYQTVIDGVLPKLTKHKKKAWPKFPVNLGNLTLQSPTHASLVGKDFSVMNLGEAFKGMHDPVAYLDDLFAHEHVKFQYVHESEISIRS